jgi:hypothetical protein
LFDENQRTLLLKSCINHKSRYIEHIQPKLGVNKSLHLCLISFNKENISYASLVCQGKGDGGSIPIHKLIFLDFIEFNPEININGINYRLKEDVQQYFFQVSNNVGK